jgi:hypothetical protein
MLLRIRVALTMCIMVALSWGGYTLNYSLSDFTFQVENGYHRVYGRGFVCVNAPGEPELPSITLHYIIPANVRVDSLIVDDITVSEIPGQFLVYPTQMPVVSGQTAQWTPPDTSIYNSEELYPETYIEIINEGVMDGARIVTVEVHPIVYRPSARMLYILSHIEVNFALSPNMLPELRPVKRSIHCQPLFEEALKNLVENDYEIALYYQRPVLLPTNQLGQLEPFPTGPAMIICDPSFASAFQPYADWLTDQGMKAQLISPQLIYSYFEGRDSAESIRNYIKYCYQNAGGTYFILGGLDSRFSTPVPPAIPARRCFCVDILHNEPPHYDTIPADHYYCALDGDWNADGDTTWGEMEDSVDQFPEVYVGRILCPNSQEACNWVERALIYEKSPQNASSIDTAIWIHQTTWPLGPAMNIFPTHFTHIVVDNPTAYDAFALLDAGYGFTNAQTHGAMESFPTGYQCGGDTHEIWSHWSRPPAQANPKAGLNWLTNEEKYFLHYAVSCHTGFFDDPALLCVAEGFTTKWRGQCSGMPIGACASIEHTRYSLSLISHYLQWYYYSELFEEEVAPGSYSRLGFALANAKTHMNWGDDWHRWVCYATNLFGSPTTAAWTNVPGELKVSHPSRIPADVQTEFVVTVLEGETESPVQHATVCLNKPNDIYEIRKTTSSGQASFLITPQTSGTLKVTVTRFHNDGILYIQYVPSQSTCAVLDYPGGSQAWDSENITPSCLCILKGSTHLREIAVIKFGVPAEGDVYLSVYDVTGVCVTTINCGVLAPGYYERIVDLRNMASGIYFALLEQSNDKESSKFIILR